MKNLLIYISPTGSFDNPRSDLTSNDADPLVKVQIDNSLALGWKKKDLLLVTNFDFQYRGVAATVFKDIRFFNRQPQASKINAIVKLFENGVIKDNELYWFHDLDAFQLEPITEAEINLSNTDMALTDCQGLLFLGDSRWSTGSIFFRSGSKDIFYQIKEVMYRGNCDEEKALGVLTVGDWGIRQRVKKINSSYNFIGYNIPLIYKNAIKPLKVAHFHPLVGSKDLGTENCLRLFMGENEINTPLITKRLIKILDKHGIRQEGIKQPPLEIKPTEIKPIQKMFIPHLGKTRTTHIGMLVKVLLLSQGDVIELGTGLFSTPLLHWVCKDMNRKLISYENNPAIYSYARQFQSRLHRIRFVKNWEEIDTKTHCGLVLVDNAPWDKQSLDVIRFKDTADYIVIHGTHREQYYIDVWKHFKHIYTWKGSSPWTSVVSNFKDLSAL